MEEFINDKAEFLEEIRVAENLVINDKTLPAQVFVSEFRNYTFSNFDEIFTSEFFERMVEFLRRTQETVFTLLSLRPHPESYFFKHFKKYPLIRIPISWPVEKYVSSVFADPGESPADAIVYNSSELIIHSESLNWCIYGNRDFELAVFAAIDNNLVSVWHEVYEHTFDAKTAIEDILRPAWAPNELPTEFIQQLLANYDWRAQAPRNKSGSDVML